MVCVFGCNCLGIAVRGVAIHKWVKSRSWHINVIVTSDSPRTEDPAKLFLDIVAGMEGAPTTIEDRAATILYAVKHAGVNDVILLAGKRHENYQDINGRNGRFQIRNTRACLSNGGDQCHHERRSS